MSCWCVRGPPCFAFLKHFALCTVSALFLGRSLCRKSCKLWTVEVRAAIKCYFLKISCSENLETRFVLFHERWKIFLSRFCSLAFMREISRGEGEKGNSWRHEAVWKLFCERLVRFSCLGDGWGEWELYIIWNDNWRSDWCTLWPLTPTRDSTGSIGDFGSIRQIT